MIRSLILALAALCSVSCKAATESEQASSALPTKFGLLEFMRASHDLKLDGEVLLKSGQTADPYGHQLVLLKVEAFVAPTGEAKVIEGGKQIDKRFVDRVVVAEAVDGTCARSFIVIDLRGDKPSVSERFGLNPEGKSCLRFNRAKWGKKESYFYLDGPLKYVYYTGGKVIGPID